MSAGGHSHNIGGRNQETVEGGQRPVGSRDQRLVGSRDQRPEGSRNQRRAYNFLHKRALEDGILFREFELRGAVQAGTGKPTARSQNWKKKQHQNRDPERKKPEQCDTATSIDKLFYDMQSHTADCLHKYDPDKPCYCMGPHTALIPICSCDHCPESSSGLRPEGSCDQRPDDFRKFELRKATKAGSKPTARSQNWKKIQQQKRAAEGRNPEERDTATSIDKPFCDMQYHTADCLHKYDPDEPCYNIGPHTGSIPVCESPSYKFDLSDNEPCYYGIDLGYEIDW